MDHQLEPLYSRGKLNEFLKMQDIHLTKLRGQNFLLDKNILNKIKQSIPLNGSQNIIEIGGGLGHLTFFLSSEVKNLFVFEIDYKLITLLEEFFKSDDRVRIIGEDFLKSNIKGIIEEYKPISIIANVPYNITSPIIDKCFSCHKDIDEMVLLVQKEFAQRIVAKKGDKSYGSFSVYCQNFSEVSILFDVSKRVFFPEPKVDSTVIKLKLKKETGIKDIDFFSRNMKFIFSKRRKTLLNSLKMIPDLEIEENKLLEVLEKLNIEAKTRPEELEPEQFKEMINNLYDLAG